ncbi:MAG TPA: efflux RND transporter periplasmic adaptor subunit, partial [Pirellulales bacterium]|nr:efflux RND transporter periplasmic adaptor subunit [Pirellulales bacterium]
MTNWKAAIAVLVLAGISGCARSAAELPQDAADEEHPAPAIAVHVTPAEHRTLEQSVKALAQCEALVGKLATLTPALEGHVHAILATQGARVKAGQPIVELDQTIPKADVGEKTAIRDAAKATLELLTSLPRPEEQHISKLAIGQAAVALARAQSVLDQLKPLAERNEVSKQQLFDAEKAVEQARLQKESTEAQFTLSMLGPRVEAIAEAKARIAIADETLKASQARLELHTIRAPIDGILEDLTCHPGQTIAVGTPVGEVVDSGQLYALAWLPARAAQLVRVGQKAKVFGGALDHSEKASDDDEGSPKAEPFVAAEVVFVGQVADAQTGNLPVRCLVENTDARLAIGQTVSIAITVKEELEVLSVPTAAIFDLGEGPLVNVVRDGKTVVLHPQLGTSHEGWVAVSGTDLEPGEPVIVEGGYNLKEDTPVTVEDAPREEEHETQ